MEQIIDNTVVEAINELNRLGQPYGIRTLVAATGLADKTISKAILRLESSKQLRVIRHGPGVRHEYIVIK